MRRSTLVAIGNTPAYFIETIETRYPASTSQFDLASPNSRLIVKHSKYILGNLPLNLYWDYRHGSSGRSNYQDMVYHHRILNELTHF